MIARRFIVPAMLVVAQANGVVAAQPGMKAVQALAFPVGKDQSTTVKLPAKTRNVGFRVQGGQLHCTKVALVGNDGGSSSVFLNSDLPDKTWMGQGAAAGSFYTGVEVNCRAISPDARLAITADGEK